MLGPRRMACRRQVVDLAHVSRCRGPQARDHPAANRLTEHQGASHAPSSCPGSCPRSWRPAYSLLRAVPRCACVGVIGHRWPLLSNLARPRDGPALARSADGRHPRCAPSEPRPTTVSHDGGCADRPRTRMPRRTPAGLSHATDLCRQLDQLTTLGPVMTVHEYSAWEAGLTWGKLRG